VIAKDFPKNRDAPIEVRFLDEAVRPELRQQLVLLDQVAAVRDEHAKEVEDLRGEGDRLAVAQQEVLGWVQDKGTRTRSAGVIRGS
jgi:hypothetical protein